MHERLFAVKNRQQVRLTDSDSKVGKKQMSEERKQAQEKMQKKLQSQGELFYNFLFYLKTFCIFLFCYKYDSLAFLMTICFLGIHTQTLVIQMYPHWLV